MVGTVVEFPARTQSLSALRAAAYRLIGQATCQIDTRDNIHHCILDGVAKSRMSEDELRVRFLDLVTDENLREQIATASEPTRNLILALAFGALARAQDAKD
jgi:His-Xaa-Ser system protein HxsD